MANFKMKGFSEHQTTDLTKKPTGPRATPKKSKEVAGDVDLSPGFEDPIKIQKVQREGLTPHSQKFSDKAFLKSQREEEVKRSDFDEGSEQQKMFDRNQAKSKAKKAPNKIYSKPKGKRTEY